MTDVFDQVKVLMTTSEVSRHQQIGLWMKNQASKFSFFLKSPCTPDLEKERKKREKKEASDLARQTKSIELCVIFSLHHHGNTPVFTGELNHQFHPVS